MRLNFVGPSYVFPTVNFDSQRAVNLFLVSREVSTSRTQFIFSPTPGKQLFCTLPTQTTRGMIQTDNRAFIVCYNKFYEIFSDNTYTERGTLNTFTSTVSMADNGSQIIIVDGTADGWIFNYDTDTFSQITDVSFEGGVTACFIGGRFLVNRPNTSVYQISDLYDGLSWDGTLTAVPEGIPDGLVSVIAYNTQVYLIGTQSTEVIYNSGASPFPLDSVQGVFIKYGSNAPYTAKTVANSLIYVAQNEEGGNIIIKLDAYTPLKISNVAIENYIKQYNLSQAVAYTYEEDGHFFYVLNIPGAPTSLVYDVTEGQWHERAFWNTASGKYERDRGNHHIYIFGKHLVSDYENGNIYVQSIDYVDEPEGLIRRERVLPYFTDSETDFFIYFDNFIVQMTTGIGVTTGSTENTNPQIMLSWSDDNGHTWIAGDIIPVGKVGQYNQRVKWNRLGRSRQRIFKVVIIAAVKVYMYDAKAKVRIGNA